MIYYFQKLGNGFKSTIDYCPCGCNEKLDSKYRANKSGNHVIQEVFGNLEKTKNRDCELSAL